MVETTVYLLALAPAVIWGFTPILSKRGMAGGGSSLQASLVVVSVDTSIYVLILLATRGPDAFVGVPIESVLLFVLAGVVGTALGRLAIFTGIDRVGAAVNTAAVSIRPLFATILAVFLLGETVGVETALGILVVVAGLGLLAISKGGDVSGWSATDLVFPLAAALFFAIGNVVRRFGLLTYPDVALLEAVALNEFGSLIALGTFAVVAGRRDVLRAPRRTYAYFAGSGALTAAALFSLFAALQQGRVSIVDPLAATAPVFATIFTALLLRDLEQVTRRVVAGAALVALGVGVITGL